MMSITPRFPELGGGGGRADIGKIGGVCGGGWTPSVGIGDWVWYGPGAE